METTLSGWREEEGEVLDTQGGWMVEGNVVMTGNI